MPVDDNNNSAESPRGKPQTSAPRARRRRVVTRRNAVISGIAIAVGAILLILIGLIAYRMGAVDRYVAGQIKDTLAKYGIRAEIKESHTSLSPQTVEMLDVELYDASTGEKLGKIDRVLATVRIEDLYALNLRRNINLKDLSVEGLEVWVNFDSQGRSNFRNIHIPPPEPNARILFAYSTAHVELKNAHVHYGDALHSLSGEARNLRATIQPDDPNNPAGSGMNTFTLSAANSTFVYDGRPINNIDVDATGRVNETRAEIQDLTVRSPVAEAHLQGVLDDWRALKYRLNVTSTVDLTQASDILQAGTTLRGAGNFVGTISGEGERYRAEGSIKSDALAADGVRLQGLNVRAKGSGQGKSYDFNGRAVAELLTAGDFQLNAVQITGGVMGTGSDFRWIGELRAAAEKSYGTTIAGLILRDARAEYRDGVLTASAPQLTSSSVTSADAKVQQGIQANDLRVKVQNGTTTATVASAKAGKIEAANATLDGVTINNIDVTSRAGTAVVNMKEAQVGDAHALGAQTGSINIAGVRLAIHNGRIEGSTNDINVGPVTLEQGRLDGVKVARPVFVIEPSGRYRVSSDLSIGGGVLGEMKLGPARADVIATGDQVQLNNFSAETLNGRARGNAVIARTKGGASHVSANFDNFDLRAIAALTGHPLPLASKATGKADVTFIGTEQSTVFSTMTGTITAQLTGAAAASSDLIPLSGDLQLTATRGQFEIQRANLQTTATRLNAAGQFSIEEPTSNLRIDVASTDAAEIQHLLIDSGAISVAEDDFQRYQIELGGKLVFNGTLNGALKDPMISGHAELGSLSIRNHELGSLVANISSTATETRVTEGRLVQNAGGSAQFALAIPRTGENNISIEATVNRISGELLVTLADAFKKGLFPEGTRIQADLSGQIRVSGIPNNMSGVADLSSGAGRINDEPLQSLTVHATFAGSTIMFDSVEATLDAGHLAGHGKFDTATKAFEVVARGDRVQLARLEALADRPSLPKLTGTAVIKDLTARGILNDVSTYEINFDAESTNVMVEGHPVGAVKLIGATANKQLDITFTTTGLLGQQAQVVTARIDLSNEKLPAKVDSTVSNADLTQILNILLPESDVAVSGRATGTLKLSGNLRTENEQQEEVFSLKGLTGTAAFSEFWVEVKETRLTAAGPVLIDVGASDITVHQTQFTGPGTNVTLGGPIATSHGGRQDFKVDGSVNLTILSRLSPDLFSSGKAEVALQVAGTHEKTLVKGTATVTGASVSVLVGDQRITLANLDGSIRFNADQAQIERFTGTLGSGKVTASGGALIAGPSRGRFIFNIHGVNVTLNYPQDFRSTVDADLDLSGDLKSQFVSGNVFVRHTEYTKDVKLEELINRRPQASIEEGGQFTFAQTTNLDKLHVEGRNALVMHNNLGDVVASVSLQLDGPITDPIVQGRITSTRGTLNFRNSPYELTRGLVEFPARFGADPIINIEGQSVIRGYRVTVLLEGPLSHPTTNVSSEPSLPQGDVVSLVLNGTLSTTDTSTSVLAQSGLGTAASLLTDALVNAPVSRATNKLFGLSRVEINPVIVGNSSTPTARLTVARRVSKDLTVIYSTNIASDPNQVLSVEYRLSDRVSFVADYEQGSLRNLSTRNNNYSFEIRFRKRF
jgi:translocation and assembly module TamB